MASSTAGSLAGGFVVKKLAACRARRVQTEDKVGSGEEKKPPLPAQAHGSNSVLLWAVTLASFLEALAQIGRFYAACASAEQLSSEQGQAALQALIVYESFCGGLLTTIIF